MTSLTQATIEEMREIATRICRDYLTGPWKSITSQEIKLRRISGGLSNFLYYVSLPDPNDNNDDTITSLSKDLVSQSTEPKRIRTDSGTNLAEPREVLLRIYGQIHGESALETMLTESVVFTLLSERNLGPKLHGIFPGGRIEQFIPARALATNELSDYKISIKIAEKMAEIHSLNIPVSKEPDWLWNSMDRWLKTIETILKDFNDDKFQAQYTEIKTTNLLDEVSWIKSVILKGDHPVLFCHNDLQEGNILLKEYTNNIICDLSIDNLSNVLEDSGSGASMKNHNFGAVGETENGNISNVVNGNTRKRSIRNEEIYCDLDNTRDSLFSGHSEHSEYIEPDLIIIDYEYCAYNYRGFDLANHFLEWTIDYTNEKFPFFYHHKLQYPTEHQRRDFISTYLRKLNEIDNQIHNYDEHLIKKVDDEVRVFTMVSHLFWCLWGIVNVHQNIEFGYWNYAVCRLQEYLKAKNDYLSSQSNSNA